MVHIIDCLWIVYTIQMNAMDGMAVFYVKNYSKILSTRQFHYLALVY